MNNGLITLGTIRRIVNFYNCASKDLTRITINGVQLRKRDNGYIDLMSTDGHAMVYDSYNIGDEVSCDLWFSRDLEAGLKALIKSYPKHFDDGCQLPLVNNEIQGHFGISVKLVDQHNKIPNSIYSYVTGDHDSRETMIVVFNPLLLMNIYKALGVKSGKGIKLEFKGPSEALRVSSADVTAIGVLMPMRV